MGIIKKINIGKDMEKMESSYIALATVIWCGHFGNSHVLKSLTLELSCDPQILFLGM